MPVNPKTAIWAAEITVFDTVALIEQTLYVASSGNFTIGGNPASDQFLMVMGEDFSFIAQRHAFGGAKTSGPGESTVGLVELTNNLGALDGWRNYVVDGRAIEFKIGPDGGEYNTDFEVAGHYGQDAAVASPKKYTISLMDWRAALEVPVQPLLYAGDNVNGVGLEGTESLRGKAPPWGFGNTRNSLCELVNEQRLIYHVRSRRCSSISVVRDRGVPITSGASSWTSITNPFAGGDVIRGSASNGAGTVILVGDGGKIAVSTDNGLTYASSTSGVATALNCAEWYAAAGLFIVGGASGVILTSATGASGSWTSQTSTFSSSAINAIAVTDAIVGIYGDDGKAASSVNGTSYSSRTSQFGASHIYGAAARRTPRGWLIAIVGQAGKISTSPDAVTFTAQTAPVALALPLTLRTVAGGRRVFVASGDPTGTGGLILYSADGVTWTEVQTALFGANAIRAIGVDDANLFVAGDANGRLATSTDDGKSWTFQTNTAGSRSYYSVTNTGSVWIATSAAGIADRAQGAGSYASLADLEDDAQAPPEHTYKAYIGDDGVYIRLGSPADNPVTCDVTEEFDGNQLTAPEDFANGAWVKTNLTVDDDAAAAPTGPTTADKLEATATAATSNYQEVVATAEQGTFSVYIAKGSGAAHANAYGIRNETQGVNLGFVTVDQDTLEVTQSIGSGAYTKVSEGTAGWGRLAIPVDAGIAIGDTLRCYVAFTGGVNTAGHYSYAWGARFDPRPYASKYEGTSADPVPASAALAAWLVLQEGGFGLADFRSDRLTDLDEDNNAPIQRHVADGDQRTRAALLDEIFGTVGAWWNTDADGLVDCARLEAPAVNLVETPDLIASSPWQNVGGTTTAVDDVAVYAGRSFTRIVDADAGSWATPVTIAKSGVHHVRIRIRKDGSVTGTFALGLYDTDAPAERAYVTGIIAADGTITVTATAGTVVGLVAEGEGVYSVGIRGTGVIAANDHLLYAAGNGTASSFLVTRAELWQGDADITLDTGMEDLTESESADENGGLPTTRTIVRYARNWHPLAGNEIGGSVTEAERVLLEKEWLDVDTDLDAAIVTAHPLAKPRTIETLFVDAADAQAECDRQQALVGVSGRRWHSVQMLMTAPIYALPMGAIADVKADRFNLGAGARRVVLGIEPNVRDGSVTFLTWG